MRITGWPALSRVLASCMLAACSTSDRHAVPAPSGEVRFVATDDGYVSPNSVPAGVVHVVFENRGSEIHELMFVKLPDGMSSDEDATLRLIDYRFELSAGLSHGPQVIRVETPGPSLHEVDFFRLHDGRTLADLRRWKAGGQRGPAPADAIGGVMDYHDIRRVVRVRAHFRPGRYVFWCAMDMAPAAEGAAGEVSHADVGMFLEFVVH